MSQLRPILIACAGMTLIGVNVSVRGALLPNILDDLNLSYTIGGTINMFSSLAYLSATMFCGILADRHGSRKTLQAGLLACGAGLVLFSASSLVLLLCLFALSIGIGNAFIEVSANKIISDNHPSDKARYMNLLHVFFGVGALLTPLYCGILLSHGAGWRFTLAGAALLAAASLLLDRGMPDRAVSVRINPPSPARLVALFRNSRLRWVFLLIGLHTASEVGTSTWLVNFLQAQHHAGTVASTLTLSLFFAGMTGGRMMGAVASRLFSHGWVPSVLGVLSVASLAAGMRYGEWAGVIFLLCGFSYSVIFPLLAVIATEENGESAGVVLGAYGFCGGIGASIHIWWMGFANDLWGVQVGFASVLALKVVFTILALRLWKQHAHPHDLTTVEGIVAQEAA